MKDLEESDFALIAVVFWNLPKRNKENHHDSRSRAISEGSTIRLEIESITAVCLPAFKYNASSGRYLLCSRF